MSVTKIIADTTRCYRGSEQETANAIRTLCTQQDVSDSDLVLITRADQSEIRQEFQGPAKCVEVPGDVLQAPDQGSQQVLSALAKIVGNRECERVVVLSYHGRTLKAAAGFPACGIQVLVHSLSNVRVISGRQAEQTWNFEHVVPLGDALRVLSLVLQRRRCFSNPSSARQTDLRIMMSAEDARFGGRGSATGTVGMMSALVKFAQARGLICVDRTQFQNPRVWLADSLHAGSSRSITQPNGCAASISVPTSTASIEQTVPHEVGEPGGGAGAEPGGGSGSDVVGIGNLPGAGPGQNDGKAPETSTLTRSEVFERDIAAKKMGPYATCRPAMFRALEELVAEKPGMFVLDLIDAAKQRAKEILLGSDRTKERAAQHPWGAIGVFMANLLTQSGVLLAEDGKPVPKGFSGSLAPVHSLAPEWQTKADAEILLSLLACRDDVSQHDLPSLAGALYHSREKAQGKVALAIACLLASNRAIETQVDGTLYLRANKDRAAAAQPMPTGTVRG